MKTISLLDTKINPLTMSDLQEIITQAVLEGQRWIIANHNLHSVYLFQRDPKFREFYAQAKLAHIDGMSLVLLGKLFGYPLSRDQRVAYVDFIRPLMAAAEKSGWRIFLLGNRPGVGEKAEAILKAEYPGLNIKTHHGYFDNRPESAENGEVVSLINDFSPNVLMVGMGMPRQEHWILDNIERLDTNAVLAMGACMDFIAGEIPTPPRWIGRIGLEWLYRLLSEPRRLWKRYLIEPWFIFYILIKRLFAGQHANEKKD